MSFESAITCTRPVRPTPRAGALGRGTHSGPMSMRARQSQRSGRCPRGAPWSFRPSDAGRRRTSSARRSAKKEAYDILRRRHSGREAAIERLPRRGPPPRTKAPARQPPRRVWPRPSRSHPAPRRPDSPGRCSSQAPRPSRRRTHPRTISDDFRRGRRPSRSSPPARDAARPRRLALSPVSFSSRLGATLTPATYVAWFAANSSGVRSAKRVTIFFIPPAPTAPRARRCAARCAACCAAG